MNDVAVTDKTPSKMGRVLIVAGSDPSGGAGIQADIKTVTMLGQYAASAITAVTVQNTHGVSAVQGLSSDIIQAQMNAVLSDIGADTIKTGMLHSADVVCAVVDVIKASSFGGKLVVDPVMVATSGDQLIDDPAVDVMRDSLFPLAAMITPNIPEAEVLTGLTIRSVDDMEIAARKLLSFGPKAVVLKGGHMESEILVDMLVTDTDKHEIKSRKLNTLHTHGTGCTFASALAALIAGGMNMIDAFEAAHAFVREAIEKAPGFGDGHGPLGHAHVTKAATW